MENASKALLIAGAILLCILIIAIGMFIYNSASSTITDSLTSLSTQEVEAFNNQFSSYQGIQKGTNIKTLMGKLIANASTYADEPAKIPWVATNLRQFWPCVWCTCGSSRSNTIVYRWLW